MDYPHTIIQLNVIENAAPRFWIAPPMQELVDLSNDHKIFGVAVDLPTKLNQSTQTGLLKLIRQSDYSIVVDLSRPDLRWSTMYQKNGKTYYDGDPIVWELVKIYQYV